MERKWTTIKVSDEVLALIKERRIALEAVRGRKVGLGEALADLLATYGVS